MQRLESERRAVQIMTIHKAKGLEAAVVFVGGRLVAAVRARATCASTTRAAGGSRGWASPSRAT